MKFSKFKAVRQRFIWSLLLLLGVFNSAYLFAANPNVAVTATPTNSPVQIQATGGNFDVTRDVQNMEATSQAFDLWTIATYPDGVVVNPVHGVEALTLPGAWSANNRATFTLDALAPEGLYTITTAVGVYPSIIWNSSNISVEKLPEAPPGGGTAWYVQPSGTSKYLTDIHFADALNGWAVGITNTIIHTNDGGDNWYAQSSPPSTNYYSVHFVDSQNGWAVGSAGRIAATRDGGNTWTSQTSGTSQQLNAVYFVDSDTGWFVGGKARTFSAPYQFIYKTEDGGNTWSRQYFRYNKDPLQKLVFVDKEVGWAIGETGVILSTTDGGQSWKDQTSGTAQHLRGIGFINKEQGWIVGRGGTVLYTNNAGDSWSPVDVGTTATLSDVQFTDSQNGWIVGSEGTTNVILSTRDGGSSWQQQSSESTNALTSMSLTDSATGWAAGLGGTILHTITGGE